MKQITVQTSNQHLPDFFDSNETSYKTIIARITLNLLKS